MFRSAVVLALTLLVAPAAATPHSATDAIAAGSASGALVLVDSAGHRLATLTAHRGWVDTDPAWSPDGKRLAFTRTKNEYKSFQVYVMRADGGGVRRLTNGRFDERTCVVSRRTLDRLPVDDGHPPRPSPTAPGRGSSRTPTAPAVRPGRRSGDSRSRGTRRSPRTGPRLVSKP